MNTKQTNKVTGYSARFAAVDGAFIIRRTTLPAIAKAVRDRIGEHAPDGWVSDDGIVRWAGCFAHYDNGDRTELCPGDVYHVKAARPYRVEFSGGRAAEDCATLTQARHIARGYVYAGRVRSERVIVRPGVACGEWERGAVRATVRRVAQGWTIDRESGRVAAIGGAL